jgi:hypothetical protein
MPDRRVLCNKMDKGHKGRKGPKRPKGPKRQRTQGLIFSKSFVHLFFLLKTKLNSL